MSTSAAHKLANARYRQNKRKTITADIAKEKSEVYQAFAASVGLSISALIQRGIEEFIQNHASENFLVQTITAQPTEKISANQRRLLDAVEKLPADAQKSLLKFIESLSKAENTDKCAENLP